MFACVRACVHQCVSLCVRQRVKLCGCVCGSVLITSTCVAREIGGSVDGVIFLLVTVLTSA